PESRLSPCLRMFRMSQVGGESRRRARGCPFIAASTRCVNAGDLQFGGTWTPLRRDAHGPVGPARSGACVASIGGHGYKAPLVDVPLQDPQMRRFQLLLTAFSLSLAALAAGCSTEDAS